MNRDINEERRAWKDLVCFRFGIDCNKRIHCGFISEKDKSKLRFAKSFFAFNSSKLFYKTRIPAIDYSLRDFSA